MNSKKAKQARREAREKQGNGKATTCYMVEFRNGGLMEWEVTQTLHNYRTIATFIATDENYPSQQWIGEEALEVCAGLEKLASRALHEAGEWIQEQYPYSNVMEAAVTWSAAGETVPTDAEAFIALQRRYRAAAQSRQ